MSGGIQIHGIEQVRSQLNAELSKLSGNVASGLEVAGKFIEAEAKELTSVDQGILINSSFSQLGGSRQSPTVTVGYTAAHAPFVHEMPESTEWNRAGAEAKFLEKAVTRNLQKILNIVANIAKRG